MRLSLSIAVRFLFSSKGQTTLIAVGIAVGVAVMIFIGSLINGLQVSLIDSVIGRTAHISVIYEPEDKKEDVVFSGYEKWIRKIQKMNIDLTGISPSLTRSGYLLNDILFEPIVVKGIDIDRGDKIYKIKSSITEGRIYRNRNEMIVGSELLKKLEIQIGDRVILKTPFDTKREYVVSGSFTFGNSGIDGNWIFMDLNEVQDFYGIQNKVSEIEIQIRDFMNADVTAQAVKKTIYNEPLTVEDWKGQNASLLTALNSQSVSTYMIQVFVLISVLLGIASVLAISVVQKSKQIGILKAMGLKDSDSRAIFLYQGFILGVIGTILGVLFAYLLIQMFMTFAKDENGKNVFDIILQWDYVIKIAIVSVISTTIASIIPARRSSMLDPIEVIKNG